LVGQGLEAALERKARTTPPHQPVCDGEAEAKLIALRCTKPLKFSNIFMLESLIILR
jgi:hypothetical protein